MNERDGKLDRNRWPNAGEDFNTNGKQQVLALRKIFASILIIVGFIIACWTAYMVYTAIQNPEALPLYRDIASEISEGQIKSKGSEIEVVLPSSFMAALVTFLLLIISSSVSATLITQGVNLINLDMLKLLRKLDSLKAHFGNKFLALKEIMQRK